MVLQRGGGYGRILCIVTAAVLFAGMFVQITMLSRVSEKSKQASALEKEILQLGVEADNLELRINQYHNLEQIAARALELGMVQGDDTQIRAIRLDTPAEAAGSGGEENLPAGRDAAWY